MDKVDEVIKRRRQHRPVRSPQTRDLCPILELPICRMLVEVISYNVPSFVTPNQVAVHIIDRRYRTLRLDNSCFLARYRRDQDHLAVRGRYRDLIVPNLSGAGNEIWINLAPGQRFRSSVESRDRAGGRYADDLSVRDLQSSFTAGKKGNIQVRNTCLPTQRPQ